MSVDARSALALFDELPWAERLLVRARLATAPLEHVAAQVPPGHVIDIGCGHGLLTALLALDSKRSVLGVDPDERKIQLARDSVGRLANVEFRVATAPMVGERSEFDAAVIADVLYLLPIAQWHSVLVAARELLKPEGRLVLKEAENDGSWRHLKTLAQEQLIVRLLGKTKSSGAIAFYPRSTLLGAVEGAGFRVTGVEPLGAGYSTPHVLICAERV